MMTGLIAPGATVNVGVGKALTVTLVVAVLWQPPTATKLHVTVYVPGALDARLIAPVL